MAHKRENDYFELLCRQVAHCTEAAGLLQAILADFDPAALQDQLASLHQVEHRADLVKHEMMEKLLHEFITPIEREDILLLSQSIDEITDKIEDVMLRLWCNNIQSIRPDAIELGAVLINCCEELRLLLDEFADFRKSKKLREYIIHINTMEEQADKLFIDSMRRLHTTCTDPLEIISWREIYIYMEKCADACEHVADAVESVIMKNS